jgi:hypothetical protein
LSLVVAGVFELAVYGSKEVPALYDHAPWLNDPYDTAVSFALFCVPLVAVPSAIRLLAGHGQPPAAGRLIDLIRACDVTLTAIALTLAACWSALAASANRPAWTSVTGIQVAALGLISAGTVAAAVGLRVAATALRRDAPAVPGNGPTGDNPDWLDDLVEVGQRLATLAGPAGRPVRRALTWSGARAVPVIRRHPVGTAAVVATATGALVAIAQSVGEGYRLDLAVVFFTITASGVFAFVMVAGSYLRVVRADRPGRRPTAVLRAAVLAAAAVPITLAFRTPLWSLVGARSEASGLPALCLLLAAAALVAFTASLAAQHLATAPRRRRLR